MGLTTKDLIKILPFEEEFRKKLFDQFDILSDGQRFNIVQALWGTYAALYQLKIEENLELALIRAKKGQEKLDKDFYKRVHKQTDEQMQREALKNVEEKDLEKARKAMELIVEEMKKANMAIKVD